MACGGSKTTWKAKTIHYTDKEWDSQKKEWVDKQKTKVVQESETCPGCSDCQKQE